MSKPAAFKGWICALCIVPVLAIAVTVLAFSPARHGQAHSAATVAPKPGAVTPAVRGRVQASYAALPLSFEANQGQTDSQVKYMARGDGYTLFLTANDAVFSLQSRSSQKAKSARRTQIDSNAVVHMQLVGGNSVAKVSASSQLPGKSNYFLGNDPSKWHADVPHFARVSYQDVYPGVNLTFHGAQRQTEFDFVVAPGANPAPIGVRFTGAQGIKTDNSGNLIISSAAGDVQLHKPVAYQEQSGARQAVDARFVLEARNQVRFELGNYDHSRELVIDPSVAVAYSTYLGGSGTDQGFAIAIDGSGNAYVTGETTSANFPHATGYGGMGDAFVSKISADGSTLVYSTYVGGSLADSGNAIAVNASGDAFVAGATASTNFPVKPSSAFQTSLNGSQNAFVFELGSNGSIVYSTYLGGSGFDIAFGIALSSVSIGDVYVVGRTSSTNFPTTLNPLQGFLTGSVNSGFVTKLNSSGTALVYSTYLGGSTSTGDTDSTNAVAVDSSDNAYLTGQTFSSSFHTTSGVVQPTCGSCSNGNSNAFVTVINPAGSSYIYSTFLGGSALDAGNSIAVDSSGNAYVTGTTNSSNFPTTSGVLQKSYGGGTDAFVTKLNSTGTALTYSTFLGGSAFDAGSGIAIDGNGNAYVTGQTMSSSFPTMGATQSSLKGSSDAFVSEVSSGGSALLFSTYLGGSVDEDDLTYGAIAVESLGANIYVTGDTTSTDFPAMGGFQTTSGGGTDAFVVNYSQGTSSSSSFSLSSTALTPASVSPGGLATSTVTVSSTNGFAASVTLGCNVTPTVNQGPTCSGTSTPGTPGTFTVHTTGATALLQPPAKGLSSSILYAMFMPLGGIALLGFGSSSPRRKKLLGVLLLALAISSLFLLPACGGSSHSSGGGGNGGTPAGTYTITVTGTASGATQVGSSPALTLVVN